MRCFGVEASDFFFLVEKLHCTVQKHMDIDSLIGVGAMGRFLRDLKDDSIEGDRIVVGHSTLLFETQSLFDLL